MPYNKKGTFHHIYCLSVEKYEYSADFQNSLGILDVCSTSYNRLKLNKQTKARTVHQERDKEALYSNMHINSQRKDVNLQECSHGVDRGDVYESTRLFTNVPVM